MKKYQRIYKNIIMTVSCFALPIFVFAQNPEGGGGGGPQLQNPFNGGNSLFCFVSKILNSIVLPIGAVVVVFFIIYAGFLFVTARGNEEQLKTAKKTFLYTVIGAAILLGSVAIAAVISGTLSEITNVGGLSETCPS